MNPEIANIYGNRLRVRVCGLCWDDDKLLLVNHRSLNPGNFWAPPGGGVEYGESLEIALKREFLEETGLEISSLKFAFGCEFIKDPLHAIELFFFVNLTGGTLIQGYDPELQVIQGVRFTSYEEIQSFPATETHGIFRIARNANELQSAVRFLQHLIWHSIKSSL